MQENDKKSETVKQLNNNIVTLKAKLFESNRNLSEYQEKTEAEFEMEKRKLEENSHKIIEEKSKSNHLVEKSEKKSSM